MLLTPWVGQLTLGTSATNSVLNCPYIKIYLEVATLFLRDDRRLGTRCRILDTRLSHLLAIQYVSILLCNQDQELLLSLAMARKDREAGKIELYLSRGSSPTRMVMNIYYLN